MTDLVERLHRYRPIDEWGAGVHHTICDEAADLISQQDAELERLRREVDEAKRTSVGDWANQRENDHLTIKMYEWKARAEAAEAKLAEAEKKFETADKLRVFWNDKATELASTSIDKARAWDSLNATFERGRKKGADEVRKAVFIEAAEIAEKLASDEDEEWRSACGGTVETRLAGARSWAFGRIRDLLFAKSEETRT